MGTQSMHRNFTYTLIVTVSLFSACTAPMDPLELEVTVANDEILRKAHEKFWFPSLSEKDLLSIDKAKREFNFAWQFLESPDPTTESFWSLCAPFLPVPSDRIDYSVKNVYEKEFEEDIKSPVIPKGMNYGELIHAYETHSRDFARWRHLYRKACVLKSAVEFNQLVDVRAAIETTGTGTPTDSEVTLDADLYIKNNSHDLTLTAHWIDWGVYVIGRTTPIARGAHPIEFVGGLEPGESITEDWWDELRLYDRKIRQAVQDFGLNQLYVRACLTARPGGELLLDETWPGCITWEEDLASSLPEFARELVWLIKLREDVFNETSERLTPPSTKT
jgi:hypothetical protein